MKSKKLGTLVVVALVAVLLIALIDRHRRTGDAGDLDVRLREKQAEIM